VCIRCKDPKPEKDFSPDSRNKTGRQSQCLVCTRRIRAESRDLNRQDGLCFCGASRIAGSVQCAKHQHQAKKYYSKYRNDPQAVERMKERSLRSHRAVKLAAFDAYGGRLCRCCGETHIEFLSIDHIDGKKHPDDSGAGGSQLYYWLKKKKYPVGFRVLCMNCNFAYGHAGYCPHTKNREVGLTARCSGPMVDSTMTSRA